MTAEERKALVTELVTSILAELQALEEDPEASKAEGTETSPAETPTAETLDGLGDLPEETELPVEGASIRIRWLGVIRDPRLPSPIAVGEDENGRPAMMVVATGDIYGAGDDHVWAYSPEEELGPAWEYA